MVTKYFGVEFMKEKYSAFTGETCVTFTEMNKPLETAFQMKATPQGVFIQGKLETPITNSKELNDFARLVADVWKAHQALAPKLVNLNGDEVRS